MKNIVTVKRDTDGATRVYELPEGCAIAAGDKVKVEYRDTETTATATMPSIEVEDDILGYFTTSPLRKVTARLTETRLAWDTEQDAENSATDAE